MIRRRNIQRLLLLLVYLLAGGTAVTLVILAGRRERSVPFRAMEVRVVDSARYHFVESREVKELVLKQQGVVLGRPLSGIDTRRLEKKLEQHPFILRVEVYKDVTGLLHVEVVQREPVVKVYLSGGGGMFIDREGMMLPFSHKTPVHLLVASGHIPSPRIPLPAPLQALPENHPLHGIYRMARYIVDDPLWKAQIEQIYLDRQGEYTLTPRVGSHAIYFGGIDNMERKFWKLHIFYTHALNNLGWKRYTSIDLKFKNQIVCTRR